MAISTNIDQNSWLLTNTVFQIHMEILQHLLHQNYDVIELFISYPMMPRSLLELDANYLFVNSQLFWSIIIEIAIYALSSSPQITSKVLISMDSSRG